MGDVMRHTLRFSLFLAIWIMAAFSAVTASANTSTLKCNPQRDLVWVYDSLATFDVGAKLDCTETVEILDRVNGYAKVRTRNGAEGYIPESAFSDLPAYHAQHDATRDVGNVAKDVQAKEIAKVTASNGEFVTPDGNSPEAAGAAPTAKAKTNSAKAPGSVSFLPNEMAEMNPRRASSPAGKPSASDPNKNAAAEPLSPSSAKSLEAESPAVPGTANQPVAAAASLGRAGEVTDGVGDIPEYNLKSAGEDLACRSYFSAYGLTANQLKWIAQNRKKAFPGVCPAPDVAKVDYVIIFTHDVSFFGGTLPDPVHKLNGFSDFRPLTPEDNTLMSETGADKARREYVWVFRVADGFSPEAFSPHRAFQFTKVETNSLGSNAGPKAVEDAFRFVESANR
jgi:hypothetical protein